MTTVVNALLAENAALRQRLDELERRQVAQSAESAPQELPGDAELREALAAYAHSAWSGWMRYLFSRSTITVIENAERKQERVCIIPAWAVERWQRQANTFYANLPEDEKASDRTEADKMLAVMGQHRGPDGHSVEEMTQTIRELVAEVGQQATRIADQEGELQELRNGYRCGE